MTAAPFVLFVNPPRGTFSVVSIAAMVTKGVCWTNPNTKAEEEPQLLGGDSCCVCLSSACMSGFSFFLFFLLLYPLGGDGSRTQPILHFQHQRFPRDLISCACSCLTVGAS